jgi:hypothetical protein
MFTLHLILSARAIAWAAHHALPVILRQLGF